MPSKSTPRSRTGQDREWAIQKNGVIFNFVNSPVVSKWVNSVTYGDNVPGWRDKIRQGIDATTSLSGVKVETSITPGRLHWSRPTTGLPSNAFVQGAVEGLCRLVLTPPSGDPSVISATVANNAALSKFNQKVLAVNTALMGGVVLGELRQTLGGIRNPASGLRKLVDIWLSRGRNLRANRRQSLSETTAAIGESWLEYSFHWKPLLADIDAGCRALAEINTGQGLVSQSVKAVGESFSNASELISYRTGAGMLQWREGSISKDHVIVVYRGAVRARVQNPVLMKLELFGFTPDLFVPTVWELVPYSFLIDYFTNIGDILYGWSNIAARLSWCNRTIRKSIEITRTARTDLKLVQSWQPAVTSVSCSPAMVVTSKTNVSRGSYSGSFAPDFSFEIPGFGSKRWLNIAALIASRSSDRSFHHGD
jgi:hypothetical protein